MNRNQGIVFGVLILTFVGVGAFLFQTRTETIEQTSEAYEVALENIVYEKGVVHLNGFDDQPNEIKWLSDNKVSISGSHVTYGESDIVVDLDEMTLKLGSKVNGDTSTKDLPGELMRQMDGFDLVYINTVEDYGIYKVYEDGTKDQITERMVGDSLPYFKVSDNGKKLLYVEDEHFYPVTYDFETERKKIIKHELSEDGRAFFEERVALTSDGGFLSIEEPNDIIAESKVYVYGADSGRVYGFDIMGMHPKFASDGKSLYFLYTGDDETVINRIGQLILKTRSIKYRTENTKTIYPEFYIVGENLYYITHTDNVMDDLIKMDQSFNHTVVCEDLNVESFDVAEDYIQFEQEKVLMRVDMKSSDVKQYNLDYGKRTFFDDTLFYVYDKGLYKEEDGLKRLVYESEDILSYWLNDSLSRCVVAIDQNGIELKIVAIQ